MDIVKQLRKISSEIVKDQEGYFIDPYKYNAIEPELQHRTKRIPHDVIYENSGDFLN
jgi:hypothetical protein